jgi:hypothetical protein
LDEKRALLSKQYEEIRPMMEQSYALRSQIAAARKASGNVFELPDITLRRLFAKALRTAGINGFRFHDLRHTFASHFIMKTSNLPVLQQILGHASPQMTQRYAHLAKGHFHTDADIRCFTAGSGIPRVCFQCCFCCPGNHAAISCKLSPKSIRMDTYMDTKAKKILWKYGKI